MSDLYKVIVDNGQEKERVKVKMDNRMVIAIDLARCKNCKQMYLNRIQAAVLSLEVKKNPTTFDIIHNQRFINDLLDAPIE